MDRTTVDRSKPPRPGRPKKIRFPDYFEGTLPNGLKVIVYERHDLPLAMVDFVVRGGAWYDGDKPGLANITAEMLTKGTATRTEREIAEEIESLGGSIETWTTWDCVAIGVTILSRYFRNAMEILADVTRRPTFPETELELFRERHLAYLLQRKAQPSALASLQFFRTVYEGHPYASPPDGTEESVRAIRTDHLKDLAARVILPNNSFIVAAGDVDARECFETCAELFGDWRGGETPPAADMPPPERTGVRIQIVDRPQAVQTSLRIGHVGITMKDPDYITVMLMNTLLGGYFGSRINLNLREDKGFTYHASSRFDKWMQAGPFSVATDVRNEVTDRAVEEILREMERIRSERVAKRELEDVKRYVTGSFPRQIETPLQIARSIMMIELYGLEKDFYNTFNPRVLAVTPAAILDTARRTIHPEHAVIVAAGNASLLHKTLGRFGPVEVFTPDGEPVRVADSSKGTGTP
ncbi:MAG: pitrilysin family protein [Bacteroidota bacterium]|nr:pitrilysin family protein [Bacteroidota bacterium]